MTVLSCPRTARYRFIKNASQGPSGISYYLATVLQKIFSKCSSNVRFILVRRITRFVPTKFERQRSKTYLRTCVTSEDLDQPAHSRIHITLFSGHILDSQCTGLYESSLLMHKLIRVFAGSTCNLYQFCCVPVLLL